MDGALSGVPAAADQGGDERLGDGAAGAVERRGEGGLGEAAVGEVVLEDVAEGFQGVASWGDYLRFGLFWQVEMGRRPGGEAAPLPGAPGPGGDLRRICAARVRPGRDASAEGDGGAARRYRTLSWVLCAVVFRGFLCGNVLECDPRAVWRKWRCGEPEGTPRRRGK